MKGKALRKHLTDERESPQIAKPARENSSLLSCKLMELFRYLTGACSYAVYVQKIIKHTVHICIIIY